MPQRAEIILGERATPVNCVLEERSILNSTFQANSAFVGDARPAGGSDSAVHWGACAVRCVAPVQTKLTVLTFRATQLTNQQSIRSVWQKNRLAKGLAGAQTFLCRLMERLVCLELEVT